MVSTAAFSMDRESYPTSGQAKEAKRLKSMERNREWYRKNRARKLAQQKIYDANHRSKRGVAANERRRKERLTHWNEFVQDRARSFQEQAQAQEIAFLLSLERTAKLLLARCTYCQKVPPTFGVIDRINRFVGYQHGNVLACCEECLAARGDRYFGEWETGGFL